MFRRITNIAPLRERIHNRSKKAPVPIPLLNPHLPPLIDTPPARLQNRCRSNCVPQRRKPLLVQIRRLQLSRINRPAAINELLHRHIPIPTLPVEVPILIRRVPHVKRVIPNQLTRCILCNVIPAFGLVDGDFAISSQVVEVLVGVNSCFLGRCPGSGVYTRGMLRRVVLLLPVHE